MFKIFHFYSRKFLRDNRPAFPAFSLLEVAISLALIGIFLSILPKYFKLRDYAYNLQITTLRARYIRNSLQGFVKRYGFLPCAALNKDGIGVNGSFSGFLPYRTLGIDRRFMFDGFGAPFSYVVNQFLALSTYRKKMRILTPSFPVNIFCEYGVSFCRVSSYQTREDKFKPWVDSYSKIGLQEVKIKECDSVCSLNKLQILLKNRPVLQEDHVFAFRPYVDFYNRWLRFDGFGVDFFKKLDPLAFTKLPSGKMCNVLAWALISGKGKPIINTAATNTSIEQINLDSPNLIFWQSRFDLVAQIGDPCTTQPVDLTKQWYADELRELPNSSDPRFWPCRPK